MHARTRCLYQNWLNLADRRDFWWRCRAGNRDPRSRPSRYTVFILCGCCLLCVWIAPTSLHGDYSRRESASGSSARTLFVTGHLFKSSDATTSRRPRIWRHGKEEETIFGTAKSRTRRGSAEGMAWVTAGFCILSHLGTTSVSCFGYSCVTWSMMCDLGKWKGDEHNCIGTYSHKQGGLRKGCVRS